MKRFIKGREVVKTSHKGGLVRVYYRPLKPGGPRSSEEFTPRAYAAILVTDEPAATAATPKAGE